MTAGGPGDHLASAAHDLASAAGHGHPGEPTAAQVWEARYAEADRVWSGRVNPVVAEVAGGLAPGSALDLGCGEGGDAVWLAQRGWRVTGVDLSDTAVARGMAAGAAAGIPTDRLELVAADLATWVTDARYDLVMAAYLHSWSVETPREEILRRATATVAPGGHLLVLAHAAPPPWARSAHPRGHGQRHDPHDHAHGVEDDRRFPSPEADLSTLDLDPVHWTVVVAEVRGREAIGPDGAAGTLVDSVVLVRRRAVTRPSVSG